MEEFCKHHQQTCQETIFFATRSWCLTTPPTISYMKMVTLSVYFNSETIVRHYHTYQSVWVAVSKKLPCEREGVNSEGLFAVVFTTGDLIADQEKISADCSMLLRQNRSMLLDLWSEDTVQLGFLNLFSARNFWSKKFSLKQISWAGVWLWKLWISSSSKIFPAIQYIT